MTAQCSFNKAKRNNSLLKLIFSVLLIQFCLPLQANSHIIKRKKEIIVNENDLIHRNPHKLLTNFGISFN